MARSARVALVDIIDAISLAREAAFELPFKEFEQHRIRRAATERALLTIFEAVRHLPQHIDERNPDLRWQDIRGIGNRLRHEYWMVDAKIIWEVVQNDLNALDVVARAELARIEEAGEGGAGPSAPAPCSFRPVPHPRAPRRVLLSLVAVWGTLELF